MKRNAPFPRITPSLQIVTQRPSKHDPMIVSSFILIAMAMSPNLGHASEGTDTQLSPSSGYKKGFFIQSKDEKFKLTIQGRVQAKFEYEILEEDDEAAFSIARARMTMKGHVFNKNLKYKFQTDYGKGFVSLKDFLVDYRVMPKTLHLRVGQGKKPFSRQQINSSGRLSLVDRSITDKSFGAGRDIGLSLHNNFEKSPTFEWAFGIYNGTGDKGRLQGKVTTSSGAGEIVSGKFTNVPDVFKPTVVLRLGYNYGGIKGYSEADFEGGGLRFGVATSAMIDLDFDDDKDSNFYAQADYILKLHGFSTTGAYYFKTTQDGEGLTEQSSDRWGAHVQAGYLLMNKYQPMLRYAVVDADDEKTTEMVLGFSTYFKKHNLKWQTDLAQLSTTENGSTASDYRIRSQLQLSF